MAVGRRVHDRLGGDVAAGTWPVLDDDRAGQDAPTTIVRRGARRKSHNRPRAEIRQSIAPAVLEKLALPANP